MPGLTTKVTYVYCRQEFDSEHEQHQGRSLPRMLWMRYAGPVNGLLAVGQ